MFRTVVEARRLEFSVVSAPPRVPLSFPGKV